MKRWMGGAVLAFVVAGCHAPLKPVTQLAAPVPPSASVEELAAIIASDARRSDHEPDAKLRGELAAEATRNADACLARDPQAAACLYGRAVALGLEARAHPTRAGELLKNMLEGLASAEAADPDYDQAGPARVRALVLIRAPGWPLGPGDADEGVVAARRAAALKPLYPPNLLALAEALQTTGDANGARDSYARARDAAQALPPAADRDGWIQEAEQALKHR